MVNIKINDREQVIKEMKAGMIKNIFNIVPNLSDKVLDYNEEHYNITKIINEDFEDKRKYDSEIPIGTLILSGVQARMKQQFSISELPLALTSEKVIENLGCNIYCDKEESLLKESNIRALLAKYKQYENEKPKFNNYFIEFVNKFNENYLNVTETVCNIHILDCSILDVNLKNEKYEGSTTTYKGGEKLRGYKMGMLRGVTPNGGVAEEICMSTAKDHDLTMSKDMIINSKYLKKKDHLLMDRGFLDIKFFKQLNKKEIYVIVPAKKNMEIFKAATEAAKENKKWKKHPNKKRKGQSLALVTDLELFWLSDNDKLKKPENLKLDYKINAVVIRFDKKKNKKILTDAEIIEEDDKYAYACILTNDTTLSCKQVIKMYEMRAEIEEDFRQLKDFWGLNEYKSTSYHIISFIIMVCLIGYNLYQIYKESEEGKQYIGKSLIVEEKHGLYVVKGVRTAIVTENYFGVFSQDELLDLYASSNKKERELIKSYLIL